MSEYSLILTEKQKRIVETALKLFAEEGYASTTTKLVAQEAGVSEGLIFRHFTSKEGLLQAVIAQGFERASDLFSRIIQEPDPAEVIRKTISIPFDVPESDYEFWRLQFKLKWELKNFPSDHMSPLKEALKAAFKKLGFKQVDLEVDYLISCVDGISASVLKGNLKNKKAMKSMLITKYNKLIQNQ